MTRLRQLLPVLLLAAAVGGCSGGGSSASPDRSGAASRSQAAAPVLPSRSDRPEATRSERPAATPSRAAEPSAASAPKVEVTTTTSVTVSAVVAAPPAATDDGSGDDATPWAWIVLALVVVAGLVLAAVLRARSRRRWEEWRQSARPALDAGLVSRDLLPASGREITDVGRWGEVRTGVEKADRQLLAAAATAPREEGAREAQSAAGALSGLTFALEAARLMQGAQPPPSAGQLAEADAATSARRTELDASLARLGTLLGARRE